MQIHRFEKLGASLVKDYRAFKEREVRRFLPRASTPRPKVFTSPLGDVEKIGVMYQGKQPACVGHAGSWAKKYIDFLESGTIRPYGPRWLYGQCKANDGVPNLDGTPPLVMAAVLKNKGCGLDADLPNDVELSRAEYNDISSLTPESYERAEDGKISAYAEADVEWDNLCDKIFIHRAVPLLIRCGKEFYELPNGTISWGEDLFPLRRLPMSGDGHEVVAIAYDDERIYFVNSFSDRWGRRGIGWFDRTYLSRVEQAILFFDMPQSEIDALKEKRRTIQFAIITLLKKVADILREKIINLGVKPVV